MANRGIAQRTLLICMHRWKPPRVRCRRLRTSNSDQKRPQGDLGTTNRQVSTDAPAMVGSSISRHQEINFFGPQYVSHCSLWTISERNGTQTAACRIYVPNLVCLSPSKRPPRGPLLPSGSPIGAIYELLVYSYDHDCTAAARVQALPYTLPQRASQQGQHAAQRVAVPALARVASHRS